MPKQDQEYIDGQNKKGDMIRNTVPYRESEQVQKYRESQTTIMSSERFRPQSGGVRLRSEVQRDSEQDQEHRVGSDHNQEYRESCKTGVSIIEYA